MRSQKTLAIFAAMIILTNPAQKDPGTEMTSFSGLHVDLSPGKHGQKIDQR